MAAYYSAGRPMSYSNTEESFDGGKTVYSTTTEECYDAGKLGHGTGYGHGQSHGNGGTNMYSNNTGVDSSIMYGHGGGGGGRTVYTTTTDECFDSVRPGYGQGHGYGHNDGGAMPYTTTTTESFGGGEQGQGYYKEVTQHKNRERVGEAAALAAGGFALYEGYEAKKDPAHARKHQIEAGLAGAAAVGAGGYAYHEHREQKQPGYGGKQEYRMPVHNSYCN
uniref:Uncharacterized protein n=1 Tax=Triticum aestivum TaxID=4565 RepID=A0A077S3S2_WHEAT|nr:unnamed protein product [Triticum aestivum]